MKIFQIYFNENQIEQLEPGFLPYFNQKCGLYFENDVIRALVENKEHKTNGYFGVVSHNLRKKHDLMRNQWKSVKGIHNISPRMFSRVAFKRELYSQQPEAMSMQTHAPHDTVALAERLHPGFLYHWKNVMKAIGVKYEPVEYQNVFYCNYFVATPRIYERYVRDFLTPAMDAMDKMPELMNRCPYPKKFPDHLKADLGVDHWTWHPFIAERLFTQFAHNYKLKCSHF